MSWTFSSYTRVREDTSAWSLDERAARLVDQVPWCVTEKIHGANLCVLLAASSTEQTPALRVAKRKALLAPDEAFFGYQRVIQRLHERFLALFTRMCAPDAARMTTRTGDAPGHEDPRPTHLAPGDQLMVYGELFGGHYPHPEIAPCPGVQPVQTGVWYAPDVHFCAFDLAIARGGVVHMLDVEVATARFADVALPHAAPLLVGSFADACAFDPRMTTTVPAQYGLPSLPEPNLAEGVVLKPWRHITLDTSDGPVRPALKHKIPEFAEERFHQAQPWGAAHATTLDVLEWDAVNLVTPARAEAALSKLGAPDAIAHEAWRTELVEDVFTDLDARHPGARLLLDVELQALLRAVIEDEADQAIASVRVARAMIG